MVLSGLQNLGCTSPFSAFWAGKKRARSCECQNFGVMAVCCGADMMAMKVVLWYASFAVLNYDFLQNPRVIRSNSKISIPTGFFREWYPVGPPFLQCFIMVFFFT